MDIKELYISDFFECATEKNNICTYTSKNKWECVSYQTKDVNGKLLIASYESNPEPITIETNLTGWYKIYVCTTQIGGDINHIDLSLSDDEFPTTISSCRMAPFTMWTTSENVEESFWKCADMTNQKIYIIKPNTGIKYTSNIYWIHFVKMTDDEQKAFLNYKPNKHMFAHMDGDFHINDANSTPYDFCKPIYAMKDSDVSILCEEVINDIVDYTHPNPDYVQRTDLNNQREINYLKLVNNRKEIYPLQINYAHKYNMQLFAGHRMQLSNFSFPFSSSFFKIPFVYEHKDLCCVARDGTKVDFLSYGYKEVQDFMIENMLASAKFGFDGVLNIWTRGLHLYFEEPVIKLFTEKYGNSINPYSLKETDERLIETKSDIIVDFYKRVRKAFHDFAKQNNTKEMKIYITGCFDVLSSKKDGIDILRLSKLGLIDGVIQTKLKITENVDDVLLDNETIDLDKYIEKAKTQRINERITGSRIDLLVEGTKEYRQIADKYNIDYYTEIQWETFKKPEEYVDGAKQIYNSFGCGISLWDCYPNRVNILSEWQSVKHLSNKEDVVNMSVNPCTYHKIIKILSYNGQDIRYYDPSWRG